LVARSPREGSAVCIVVDTSTRTTLVGYYAAVLANALPCIIPGPSAAHRWDRVVTAAQTLLARVEVGTIMAEERTALRLEASLAMECVALGDRRLPAPGKPPIPLSPAHLQLTGGSTGDGSLVHVPASAVEANVAALLEATSCSDGDSVASWLPLYHDMGLVGVELFALLNDLNVYTMRPWDFLRRPTLWLQTISEAHCALSPSPNFGYDHCVHGIRDHEIDDLDLESWRAALNGSEPIRAETLGRFWSRFDRSGFRAASFMTGYGLAEATLAVTLDSEARSPRVVQLERGVEEDVLPSTSALLTLEEVGKGHTGARHYVSAGPPLSGVDVLIGGIELRGSSATPFGEIEVAGRSVVSGYHEGARFNGRYATGDLGFGIDGELYVGDRRSSLIIRAGRNYSAASLEGVVARLLDVRPSAVAVFERDVLSPGEPLVAMVEGVRDSAVTARIERLRRHDELSETPIGTVFVGRSRFIPRTTSGKKRYFLCRQLVQEDGLPASVSRFNLAGDAH
jgi:acyl-CoA synthetase (AMP-forming)/AMP-acid ligase II